MGGPIADSHAQFATSPHLQKDVGEPTFTLPPFVRKMDVSVNGLDFIHLYCALVVLVACVAENSLARTC